MAISDIVKLTEDDLPAALKSDESYACWVGGAVGPMELQADLEAAGFENVEVRIKEESKEVIQGWIPGSGAEKYVASAAITATVPVEEDVD